ncbi:MAG: Fe-S cluster assembly transcriptional regulator IscR [Burkholderiales bacterium]|nr:Fe-S cluster assembly transcriptional regulator IscR [Burkholderiales bacterium]
MRLTTKGRFAVTAMVDVAMHATQSPVPLTEISTRQGISLSYLEQLFSKLRRGALVKSARGPGGGYRLAKAMDAVTVADIIVAVDEPIDATQCGGKENCHEEQKCLTHDLWVRLNEQIFEFLRSVTLAQLVEQQRAKETRVVELHDPRLSKRPQSESVAA